MIRGSIVLCCALFTSIAQAQEEPSPLAALLARARAEDARTEYREAAQSYEAYAALCLERPTAVLAEGQPCLEIGAVLDRAFELSRALGDRERAERIALAYVDHLFYAEPTHAMRIGYELAQMLLRAGALRDADRALARWIDLHPNPPPGQALLVDAMRARIAESMEQPDRAATYWRRVERRFTRDRDDIEHAEGVPLALVHEAVAEGRLRRAEVHVQRFLRTTGPNVRGAAGDSELWTAIAPWRLRTERRLLLARMELESVYELGSPGHSVVAAARIGDLYAHLVDLHTSLALPESEYLRYLISRGENLPGYDDAREHFETCVRWSHHHGVAMPWAQTCEERLHALDPHRFPIADELLGHASFLPAQLAAPSPAP
jgi:tetratricopeptide (TPR) repeat protein